MTSRDLDELSPQRTNKSFWLDGPVSITDEDDLTNPTTPGLFMLSKYAKWMS
jgi:hypothetical protein